jgi:hypothetical protein
VGVERERQRRCGRAGRFTGCNQHKRVERVERVERVKAGNGPQIGPGQDLLVQVVRAAAGPGAAKIAARLSAVAAGGDAAPDRAELLDLAAELLEAADALAAAGQHVEALALEGVQGRVMELLVGAGEHEVPLRPLWH